MGNNLAVKITADVADLQAKFAVARAETNALSVEMNKLAKASAGGTIDAAGSARLKQLAGDLVAARSQATGYAAEMSKAGYSVSGFASSLEHSHGSISTATREFRALFDELSSGRTRQTPGTVAILLQRVLGLGPAALLAVGGVGALTAGLGYLVYKAIEVSKAFDKMELGAAFAGNVGMTRDIIKSLAEQMAQASNVSSSAAREIMAGFAAMRDSSVPQINELSAVVSDFAKVTGQDAKKAGEELTKIFAGKETAEEFAKTLGSITQAQLNAAEAADKSGDANQVFAAKMDMLNAAIGRGTPIIDKRNASITAGLDNLITFIGMTQAGATKEQAQNELIAEQNVQRQRQIALLKELGNQIKSTPPSADQTLKTGVAVAEKENPVSMQIDEAKSKVTELTAALAVAQQRGDSIDIDKLNAGLVKAQENLSQLQFGPVLERMRTDMGNLAATWDGTQSGMLTKQRQIAQQALSQEQAGSKDYLAIQQEIARLTVQIRKSAAEAISANARAQLADAKYKDREAVASYRASLEEMKEGIKEFQTIDRQNVAAAIAISRSAVEAKRALVQSEVSLTAQGAAQKYAALRELVNQEYALDLEALQNELSALEEQPAEYNKVYNEILELKAKHNADMARLSKEESADTKTVTKSLEEQYQKILTPIGNTFASTISGMITKQETLRQSMQHMASSLVTDLLKSCGQMATRWAAMEIAKTAATKGGETARAAAKTAGDQASAAAGAKTVMADAAKAFSGAYAAVAQIPYVGWILAPAAGAAAFAAVAGMEGMASLDVGTAYVPRDMPAYIHEGEAVLPKPMAQSFRDGSMGGKSGSYHEEHNYHGGVSINAFDTAGMKHLLSKSGNQRQMASAARQYFRRGGR